MSSSSSSGTGGGPSCEDDAVELPAFFDGNAPEIAHDCGEPCDTDWCFCDACLAADGPELLLASGRYEADWFIGVGLPTAYRVEVVGDESGILAVNQVVVDGFENVILPFEIGEGCDTVRLRLSAAESNACSRLYDLEIREAP